MSRNCAYCGKAGPSTREHLIPKALHGRTADLTSQFLRAAGRVVGGEPTIADVCAACNHQKLSPLDAYVAGMYDKFFAHPVSSGQSVKLRYDFGLLSRWLLKVSYNSARASHSPDVAPLARFTPYILHGVPVPSRFAVFLQLVIPYSSGGHDIVPADFVRVTRIDHPTYETLFRVARIIGIRAYQFYVLAPARDDGPRQDWRNSLRRFANANKGAARLPPDLSSEVFEASTVTARELFLVHLLKNRSAYSSADANRTRSR